MIIDTLLKLLTLEMNQGLRNRAVIGGLARFGPTWLQQSREESLPPHWIDTVYAALVKYDALSPQQRESVIHELIGLVRPNGTGSDPVGANASQPEDPLDTKSYALKNHVQSSPREKRTRNKMVPLETLPALDSPLTILAGIGSNRAKLLERLDIYSLGDLLYYFPRRYDDYSKLKTINHIAPGEVLSVIGSIEKISTFQIRNSNRLLTQALLSDGSGSVTLKWFNNPYVEKQLKPGTQVIVSGKIDLYLGRFVINHPTWELLDTEHLNTNRIVPVYALTANITQRTLRNITYQCITHWAPKVPEIFPREILLEYGLVELPAAIQHAHFPESEAEIAESRNRLAFDEVFMMQMGVLGQKQQWESLTAKKYALPDDRFQLFRSHLPFQLTRCQDHAINEIRNDLLAGRPMNRLLQGEVGSGKTVVAAAAMLIMGASGMQSAIMAPTSILANQHFETLQKTLCYGEGFEPSEIRLLTSETSANEKAEIRDSLTQGKIKILVGTHALLEEPIVFAHLQLAVIDEQHRFGVDQRTLLRTKGDNPHLLVMSATPIPRSLALTVYGDLDLSVLDEMPVGRTPSMTFVLPPSQKNLAYFKITEEIGQNHQAFIVYPLIEQVDPDERHAAVQEYERLKKDVFPGFRIGLLHGRLRSSEKSQVMKEFRNGAYDILVSTTVIEVGMDIPNATVILVESANRFGLAQLHQLRGRIGRGTSQSFCYLISESDDSVENSRLLAMKESNDGFILAEKDLQERGPGDFLGERQSGFSGFRMANFSDIHLIEKARDCAKKIFAEDPHLAKPQHQLLKKAYNRYWAGLRPAPD